LSERGLAPKTTANVSWAERAATNVEAGGTPLRPGMRPGALLELAPMLRRAAALDEQSLARIVTGTATVTGLVRLPFDVLVGRTVPLAEDADRRAGDYSVLATDLLAWIDGDDAKPAARDADWRGGIPPTAGWTRVDTVPDDVIRCLVRSGARTLKDAAARDGMPGAQPRAEVAAALLDSVVLTVTSSTGERVELTLRLISAITRMGFLPHGSHVAVDLAGRWLRVAARYGSGYAERPGLRLNLGLRSS
jgi:hypothetical protein